MQRPPPTLPCRLLRGVARLATFCAAGLAPAAGFAGGGLERTGSASFATVAVAALSPLPAVSETRLKAGYLVLFTRYVAWPVETFASPRAPLIFGVIGNAPLAEDLEKEAQGASGVRPIEVRRVTMPSEVEACHAVFIDRSESRNEEAWIEATKRRSVLTVGESPQTLAHGAVILLTLGGRRPEFEIDWGAMEAARLRISSEMLARAKAVHRRSGGGR